MGPHLNMWAPKASPHPLQLQRPMFLHLNPLSKWSSSTSLRSSCQFFYELLWLTQCLLQRNICNSLGWAAKEFPVQRFLGLNGLHFKYISSTSQVLLKCNSSESQVHPKYKMFKTSASSVSDAAKCHAMLCHNDSFKDDNHSVSAHCLSQLWRKQDQLSIFCLGSESKRINSDISNAFIPLYQDPR